MVVCDVFFLFFFPSLVSAAAISTGFNVLAIRGKLKVAGKKKHLHISKVIFLEKVKYNAFSVVSETDFCFKPHHELVLGFNLLFNFVPVSCK